MTEQAPCPYGWKDARCGRFGERGPCGCTRPAPKTPQPLVHETLMLNGHQIPVVIEPELDQRGVVTWTWSYDIRMVPPPRAIRVRDPRELDGRVLLHEVLHVLVGTDPQSVLPPDDQRHEDFVRMLTAGLHDALGYRRADPPSGAATTPPPVKFCGAENPDYPGEYTCELPAGHPVPITAADVDDPGWEPWEAEHAAPSAGASWAISQPPADTQQGDERREGFVKVGHYWVPIDPLRFACCGASDTRACHRYGLCRAQGEHPSAAARPSADTETLRAQFRDLIADDQAVGWQESTPDELADRLISLVRAALDGPR